MNHHSDTKKIFFFLHALTDGKTFLTLNDAKNFLDTVDGQMHWFFDAKTNLSKGTFHFDAQVNAFVFAEEVAFDDIA
ncbi:MAG: hypothetical protein IKO74_10035 [Selenomonadaceae bacterium]|nr:hypothetical protein [Selenomonadaceae bacterium]